MRSILNELLNKNHLYILHEVVALSYPLKPPPGTVLLIENVGNLVCPALFDLGERAKVAISSVTDGVFLSCLGGRNVGSSAKL